MQRCSTELLRYLSMLLVFLLQCNTGGMSAPHRDLKRRICVTARQFLQDVGFEAHT